MEILPVVMSGAVGTRLWPLFRERYPKQLIPLVNRQTILQDTVGWLKGVPGLGSVQVVCNEAHRFMVAQQLEALNIPKRLIILEPVVRNTASAIAVTAPAVINGTTNYSSCSLLQIIN